MDECIEAYMQFAKLVFDTDKVLLGKIPVGDDQCRFDFNLLETSVKGIVAQKLQDETAAMQDTRPDSCPCFVVATPGLHAEGPPAVLRTYRCRGANADKCTVWEAARATSAAPSFFKPIRITVPPPGRTFVDGGLGHNNPAEVALAEAERIWPDKTKFRLVSIGTGRQDSVRFVESVSTEGNLENSSPGLVRQTASKVMGKIPHATNVSRTPKGVTAVTNIAKECVKLATNSEGVHQRVLARSSRGLHRFPYFRFNVEKDMAGIELQEWKKMDEMSEHTANYLAEGEGELKRDQCVEELMNIATA